MSDWLQIWTAASSFDIKNNKAIEKKFVFLANRSVFPNGHIFPQFSINTMTEHYFSYLQ